MNKFKSHVINACFYRRQKAMRFAPFLFVCVVAVASSKYWLRSETAGENVLLLGTSIVAEITEDGERYLIPQSRGGTSYLATFDKHGNADRLERIRNQGSHDRDLMIFRSNHSAFGKQFGIFGNSFPGDGNTHPWFQLVDEKGRQIDSEFSRDLEEQKILENKGIRSLRIISARQNVEKNTVLLSGTAYLDANSYRSRAWIAESDLEGRLMWSRFFSLSSEGCDHRCSSEAIGFFRQGPRVVVAVNLYRHAIGSRRTDTSGNMIFRRVKVAAIEIEQGRHQEDDELVGVQELFNSTFRPEATTAVSYQNGLVVVGSYQVAQAETTLYRQVTRLIKISNDLVLQTNVDINIGGRAALISNGKPLKNGDLLLTGTCFSRAAEDQGFCALRLNRNLSLRNHISIASEPSFSGGIGTDMAECPDFTGEMVLIGKGWSRHGSNGTLDRMLLTKVSSTLSQAP